ncbi:MAG: hypothetical protein KAQ87_00590 [Candidatus Pacebacteria bacterium]|nr:hypothetical protein [Candidatus Paceibacterota bacterium]
MPLINLLPKNFRFEEDQKKQKKVIIICSAFLALISVVSFVIIYADKAIALRESDSLDFRTEELSGKIKEEIGNNEVFLTTDKVTSIRELLDDHNYFSNAFNVMQNIISEDIYLTESGLSFNEDGNLLLEINGVANNYLAAVNQIAIFKNSYWIDDAEIDSIISSDGETGDSSEINFSGNLKFKKGVTLFREYYWDFGLALISSKVDRYIEINEYTSFLTDEESKGKNFIKVKFSGIAYDKERLISFKDNLETEKNFVKSISISYDLNEKDSNKIIEFKGEMELKLF